MAGDPASPDAFRDGRWFDTTHWSVVLAAGDSRSPCQAEALEMLCGWYWPPVYTYIRRRGYGADDAKELTQGFFARMLEKKHLQAADPAKGRFRTLILTSVSRFLANEHERALAQKRGGGAVHLSIEAEAENERLELASDGGATPEAIFERRWAEALLECVLRRLRGEFAALGHEERFDVLKVFLVAERKPPAAADVARRLSISEVGVYSAVHRLRGRYGELLREEIARTVGSPREVDEELRHLAAVMAR